MPGESAGIVAYGTYVPFWRIERAAIAAALGTQGGKGSRAVASFDEDTTTMGVAAARAALAAAPAGITPGALAFATTTPAYLDKTNATAIHAALDLDPSSLAFDMIGSVRSGTAAMTLAGSSTEATLVVLSDVRTGPPGGADEAEGGDGACAFLFAPDSPATTPLARPIGTGRMTSEFLDRWRLPHERHARTWEDRFGEDVYGGLGREALRQATERAGIEAADIDRLVVSGLHQRAVRSFAASTGLPVAVDLSASIGNTGVAHAGVMLADFLDRADPGRVAAVVVLADGADATIFRVTDEIVPYRRRRQGTATAQIEAGRNGLPYTTFLTWRGAIQRDGQRRPDPDPPSPPVAYRNRRWKFGLVGTTCEACGAVQVPPEEACNQCRTTGPMAPTPLSHRSGTIRALTTDRLAYSPFPPATVAVVDLEGGGRHACELADVNPEEVAVGDRVQMTFRRAHSSGGIHNYLWKASPARTA